MSLARRRIRNHQLPSAITGRRIPIMLRTALQAPLRPEIDVEVFEVFSAERPKKRSRTPWPVMFVTKPKGCVTDSVTAESLYWQWFPDFCNTVTTKQKKERDTRYPCRPDPQAPTFLPYLPLSLSCLFQRYVLLIPPGGHHSGRKIVFSGAMASA